ncbi:hypothetical protein BGX29_005014 [Mortierella sp. GBA35]|nr:hypothetical protein BGX29_005014 [Mortierella sp. GBA35]
MDRSNSYKNDYDTQSIRSLRSSTSGSVSEAGRTEAMSLARPRTDQEIEDRFVDFMNNMGMHEPEQRKAMIGLTVDNKWKLIFQHESQEQTKAKKREEEYVDKSSPEYFVRKLQLDGDLKVTDSKFLLALFVSLKSQPISRESDLAMELEIVKCLKTLLNNRWGAQEAIKHSSCITSLCFSITSPHLQTRKLVVEVLTFLCYCEVPMGHKLVLEGLDQAMEYWKESARFDAWMRILENTIDGRGRFGTMVGMSEELKKAGTQDGQLIEYLSNVVFINALLQVVDEIELRKMRDLKYDLIDRQLNIYEDKAENDYEDMIEFYNHQILHDMSDPYDVFHALLRSVESSRAYDFFLSLLQYILLIREEGDFRIRYFQLMDAIVTQVVLDRRGITDNFDQKLGISVNQLVGKLVDQDHGMVSQLKANIYSLEDLLRLSRYTIQTLQAKLYDVETQVQNKLAIQDTQLKHLLKSLQDANGLMADAGMPTSGGSGKSQHQILGPDEYPMIDKMKLRQLIERTKSEGAILQDQYGNHLPHSIALPDRALLKDLDKANGYKYTGPATLPPELLASVAAAGGQANGGKGAKSKNGRGSSSGSGGGNGGGDAVSVPGGMVTSSGGPPAPPPPPMMAGGIPAPPPPPPAIAGSAPPGGLGGLLNSMKKGDLNSMKKGGLKPPGGNGDDSDSDDPPAGSMAAMLAKKKKLESGEPSSPKWQTAIQSGALAGGIFGTMGQLFVAKTTEYKEPRASKEPQEILILDQRRAYQIKIMLGGMKHTYPEIRQAILRMDEDFMTLVQLSNLLKFVPDAEEIGKLLEYKDASEDVKLTLGRPEAFFVEMLKVGRYQQRLEGLKFKVTFQGMLEGVNEGISSITEASKGLKNTKHFKELLSLILILGNSMNGASHNGGAFGFKIASINKLVDTKASNAPNMTLLHFLTSITETTLPDVLNHQQEIAACGTACRVSLPDLQTNFNHLKTKIKELKTELHTHYFNGWKCSPEDRFYEVMQPFMATVEMEAQYKEFFGIFKTFTASFEKVRGDNQKQKEKELWREKAKTAAKARQEQMAAKKNRINVQGGGSHDAEGGGDDKEMMDNLLETLRNEGDNDASRRDRRRKNRVDHTPANVTVKAQDLLTSLREDRQHIPLLHE